MIDTMDNTHKFTSRMILSVGDCDIPPLPPELRFSAGTWPEGLPKTRHTLWAVARCGTVCGRFGPVLWAESSEDSQGQPVVVETYAWGIWQVGPECPGRLTDCGRLGCQEAGACLWAGHPKNKSESQDE